MVDEPTIDEQELRVAVVMNGGVSLAVWMGGVTRELDRLRRDDGAYAAIAGLTRSLPRVDVIAGSSAGGINGAVLAVAIARGSDVAPIRDIWMNAGSIGDLLRDPMQREAPSLFYGDRKHGSTRSRSRRRSRSSRGAPRRPATAPAASA